MKRFRTFISVATDIAMWGMLPVSGLFYYKNEFADAFYLLIFFIALRIPSTISIKNITINQHGKKRIKSHKWTNHKNLRTDTRWYPEPGRGGEESGTQQNSSSSNEREKNPTADDLAG